MLSSVIHYISVPLPPPEHATPRTFCQVLFNPFSLPPPPMPPAAHAMYRTPLVSHILCRHCVSPPPCRTRHISLAVVGESPSPPSHFKCHMSRPRQPFASNFALQTLGPFPAASHDGSDAIRLVLRPRRVRGCRHGYPGRGFACALSHQPPGIWRVPELAGALRWLRDAVRPTGAQGYPPELSVVVLLL